MKTLSLNIGIQQGSTGASSVSSKIHQSNLKDAVQICFEIAKEVYPDVTIQYDMPAYLTPNRQGIDLKFFSPQHEKCSGQALFLYKGTPLLLVTRAFGESGVDSTIAKFYRKQYWFEKVQRANPYFSHVAFVTAMRDNDFENFKSISEDVVFPHSINELNFGSTSVFLDQEVRGTEYMTTQIIQMLDKALKVYSKTIE